MQLPPVLLISVLMLLAAACLPQAAVDSRPRSITYVAIGASDSVGVGARDPEQDGWVYRLHARLPAGSSLINVGVSGSRLNQALDQQLPVALAAQPDLVTVWLAVNDLNARVPLERYGADLERLLGALEQTGATVLVGNVPDLAQLAPYRQLDPLLVGREIDAWNAVIASVASQHGVTLVDLHKTWSELAEHPEYLAADGFHPSSAGYARLAELYWEALEAHGGVPAGSRG